MRIYCAKVTITEDGTLIIKGLPFEAGDKVEVIVRGQESAVKRNGRYPLRGKPVRYTAPFKGVAEDDWEVLR
ncbi:MAG: hypothetical protein IT330_05480 [Anaerolineae bacterium]|nr:hypothetical protein [Anaerolineae bacterium]